MQKNIAKANYLVPSLSKNTPIHQQHQKEMRQENCQLFRTQQEATPCIGKAEKITDKKRGSRLPLL